MIMLEINKVHLGDCLELMKQIPDKSIDLVLTDPPYNASNSNIWFKDGYKTINEERDKWFDPIPHLHEWFRVIKDWWSILVFCSYHLLWKYLEYWKKIQQIIHWEYITAMPAIAKVYTPVIEYAVWFSTPRYTFNKKYSDRNVIRTTKANQNWENFDHPSVKPLELIRKLLSVHSDEWQTILDPFLWSWTTAVACKEMWRNFIWIEKEQKYVDICNKRLSNTTISLF